MKRVTHPWVLAMALTVGLFATGCQSIYYQAWEAFGKEKRDLLKDNVTSAKEAQEKATEQFKDALTRLQELYGFKGGDLEKTYGRLKSEYDQSATRAETVRTRIQKVDSVANDLFNEWEKEIATMENSRLAANSRDKLRETRSKFQSLQSSMRRAESSMAPVLNQFKDQVLYLKHNLNAQAVGSLKGESEDIEREVQRLINDLNASVAEADAFIKGLP